MSPDKQRTAIAEACGWKRRPEFDYTANLDPLFPEHGELREMWGKASGELVPLHMLPNYPTDLNAMHEAEKVLKAMRPSGVGSMGHSVAWERYKNHLRATTGEWDCIDATAAQRAEAFLRTIGKWEDSP